MTIIGNMNGKESLITNPANMEPLLPEESNRQLEDIAFDLTSKASSLAGQINPIVAMAYWESGALDELLLLQPN
jgi:hypothetical protein